MKEVLFIENQPPCSVVHKMLAVVFKNQQFLNLEIYFKNLQ